jgi:hypothetical protein
MTTGRDPEVEEYLALVEKRKERLPKPGTPLSRRRRCGGRIPCTLATGPNAMGACSIPFKY